MIFICHATNDDTFADRLSRDLQARGYETWVDHINHVPAGMHWDEYVDQQLRVAEIMILIISHAAARSPNVSAEWREFQRLRKRIIPVKVDRCPMPLLLRHIQHLSFIDDNSYDENFKRLLSSLPIIQRLTRETQMNEDDLRLSELKSQGERIWGMLSNLVEHNYSVLVFPTLEQTLKVNLIKEKLLIGWYDPQTNMRPDIDLAKYNARENGVSRQHAMLSKHTDGWQITDLSSLNGTYIDRHRLQVEKPVLLKHKALVHLGELPIQFFFKLDD
ncbi:MAG: TIR domain-containing protein [Chloroflexi bacterium]|nr:MAG: hypothetical protein CUN54_02080 [Phototrophicales bacterium]RMF81395.1 MAG: TIR domain-containing protein [Chloroflexota bacterium]